jgi:hypothetical protein
MEGPQVELGSQLQSHTAGRYPPVTGCCWRETHHLLFLAILLAISREPPATTNRETNKQSILCRLFVGFINFFLGLFIQSYTNDRE